MYTGATSNLLRRVWEHRNKLNKNSFTERYNVNKLVYYEVYYSVTDAIFREKQIKGGDRTSKETLINKFNPERKDLYGEMVEN